LPAPTIRSAASGSGPWAAHQVVPGYGFPACIRSMAALVFGSARFAEITQIGCAQLGSQACAAAVVIHHVSGTAIDIRLGEHPRSWLPPS
jgi:hypothetical protein